MTTTHLRFGGWGGVSGQQIKSVRASVKFNAKVSKAVPSASKLKFVRGAFLPCRIGNQTTVGVAGQTATAGSSNAKNFF